MTFPIRQIRAVYDNKTIRVYQAYNDAIANSALANGTFISPPFKMERMTWVKPSFLWMMYRSGWAKKDAGQNRILAIDISREGFEWALDNSLLSNKAKEFTDREAWLKLKNSTPVRIQWDPERDIYLQPLEHRAIQIGLSNEAVDLYVNQWVQKVTDVTELAAQIKGYVDNNQLEAARALLPNEVPYNLNTNLKDKIMAD
ncbi:DUF4291 domain-containing protein [Pseudoalteromonas luteoviolacea]|uniref:DUF4291 domain-containing protein n=1 Tax=Pseudoalteromonas luteoviolacea TaxID=43657 RepID=UPI001B36D81A|nr:DUF4291 domain-containing protein [Pseudoalteromonas luteoviolacea]MBQ4810327.1 DUF4291 domain-containing protein [Pseudoalteromonas luteoviolacea]